MADLPDYYTQAQISEAEAASFKGGAIAGRPLIPKARDLYFAVDEGILYYCIVDGAWEDITYACLLLAGGAMTGDIAMGGNWVTGLADPALAQDAATMAYVLAGLALYLPLAGGTMAGNIIMGGNKLTGLGAGVAAGESVRYEQLELATKEFFVPVFGGTSIVAQGALVDGGGDTALMMLLVPQDFTALTSIEIIFLPKETGASMHFTINTRYGAYNGGEDYNVHGEAEPNRDIEATVADQNLPHSIADLVDLSPMVAGDLLYVSVDYSATVVDSNAWVRGIRLNYT
ncbi:hypothetical protein ES708_30486 [subsurface metagenome]